MVAKWVIAIGLGMLLNAASAQENGLPADKLALRYRIEFLDGKDWKPVGASKKFKRDHTIRFRFIGNQAGTLYLLNASEEFASLHPVFPQGVGTDLVRQLGLGTHIAANRVGLFPDPQQGEGGLRFTGVEGVERFLLVFVPDPPNEARSLMGIALGSEGWHFDDHTTYLATGTLGQTLFHYFELKSR
ncbi:MAG: hypothetical protein IT369_04890 [Candidatus Latescibacteria bacterium]|nr:hypothetical protein [Candidatus Latescibacterota bacterium]